MENNEGKEVSLGRLFKVMFNRKIPLIAITLGTMLVGCLGINFIYNKGVETYKSEFKYNISDFNGNGKYIDGSSFYFNSLTTQKVLQSVKGNHKEYASIDVDKMIEKNAIELELNKTYDVNKNPIDTYYTLSVNQSYFTSKDQAKSFISSLINYPITYNNKIQETINYKVNLERFDQVDFFENQFSYLENQLDYILTKYDGLISTYGDVIVSQENGGKKISTLRNELSMYFTNYSINDLRIEANQKGYVKDYNNHVAILKLRQDNYKKTIKYNKQTIDSLNQQINDLLSGSSTSQSFDLSSYNAKIAELLAENVDLQKKVDDLDEQINNGKATPESFTVKLNGYREKLDNETDKYKAIEKEVMEEGTEVFFINTNVIEEDGGISTIVGAALTFVVGIVIGCVVNLILDYKYLHEDFPAKPDKKKKEAAAE